MSEQQISLGSTGSYYEILVQGQLHPYWSDWLEGLEIKLADNGVMILSGFLPDQAALMGILNKLGRLNLALLSVNRIQENKKMEDK